MKNKNIWILVAAFQVLLGAPNATVIKVAVDSADPYYWTLVRFLPIVVLCLPFIFKYRRLLWHKNVRYLLLGSGVSMSIAIIFYVLAIKYSQASYVSIITLLTPIILVLFSMFFLKERITRKATLGITLAALGAMILVVLPLALAQGVISFYPVATVFALINSVFFTLAVIQMRQANESRHVPLVVVIGINSLIVSIVSAVLFFKIGDMTKTPTTLPFWIAAAYSGVGIALLGRALMVKVFERLGAAFSSGMSYFETFLAILIPVVVLHEQLSIAMVAGGSLILLGLYVIEHHKQPHAKHHFIWRHH